MIEKFYSDLETVFRGSRELVKDRLRQYTPLLKIYLNQQEKPSFLDLGCGRGEFLEIAKNIGFDVTGVEINTIFTQECRDRGLEVYNQDILEFLKSSPDGQYDVVSLIHVAEHLEFEYLFEVFLNVHRLLKPCGLFILETPFFKSPFVSSYTFWIDPSHKTPVNPELMSFLGKWAGFYRVEHFGINADTSSGFESLADLYSYRVTPDLVMFFIKECSENQIDAELQNQIQTIKEKYSSFQPENLLTLYSNSIKNAISEINSKIENLQNTAAATSQAISEINSKIQNLQNATATTSQAISEINSKIQNLQNAYTNHLSRYSSDYTYLHNLINDTRNILFLIWDSRLWKLYRAAVEKLRYLKGLLHKKPKPQNHIHQHQTRNTTPQEIDINADSYADPFIRATLKRVKRFRS